MLAPARTAGESTARSGRRSGGEGAPFRGKVETRARDGGVQMACLVRAARLFKRRVCMMRAALFWRHLSFSFPLVPLRLSFAALLPRFARPPGPPRRPYVFTLRTLHDVGRPADGADDILFRVPLVSALLSTSARFLSSSLFALNSVPEIFFSLRERERSR